VEEDVGLGWVCVWVLGLCRLGMQYRGCGVWSLEFGLQSPKVCNARDVSLQSLVLF
jgi:hypothetical protein